MSATTESLVRPARPSDAAALARDLFAPGADAWLAALVAEFAGEAVGYAVLFRAYRVEQAETVAVVEHFYVAPEARGRGVGAALLRTCRALGRAWGCGALGVAVRGDNAAARRFYERQGMAGRPRGGIAYREVLR